MRRRNLCCTLATMILVALLQAGPGSAVVSTEVGGDSVMTVASDNVFVIGSNNTIVIERSEENH